jgi:hypothetical protein
MCLFFAWMSVASTGEDSPIQGWGRDKLGVGLFYVSDSNKFKDLHLLLPALPRSGHSDAAIKGGVRA